MIDVILVGTEVTIADTNTTRAANILSVQVGALEYAQELGIDLAYFLSEDFKFQNESFKSYLVQVLANYGINVASIDNVVETLFSDLKIAISADSNGSNLIAR